MNLEKSLKLIKDSYSLKLELIKQINCKPLNSRVKKAAELINTPIGECFKNALSLAILLDDSETCDIKVIVGVAEIIPGFVEGHGWIKLNNEHFDPTLELNGTTNSENTYYGVLKEFTVEEALEYASDNHNLPPYFPKALPDCMFTRPSYPSSISHHAFMNK